MNKENKIYRTIASAKGELALDYGFCPIPGRVTIAKLREFGYHVDRKEYDRRKKSMQHFCADCGMEITERQYDGFDGSWNFPTYCDGCRENHEKNECDNGHKWIGKNPQCPVCGEYFV
jgi:hypothetical protein